MILIDDNGAQHDGVIERIIAGMYQYLDCHKRKTDYPTSAGVMIGLDIIQDVLNDEGVQLNGME